MGQTQPQNANEYTKYEKFCHEIKILDCLLIKF